jgi:hypothetical protein
MQVDVGQRLEPRPPRRVDALADLRHVALEKRVRDRREIAHVVVLGHHEESQVADVEQPLAALRVGRRVGEHLDVVGEQDVVLQARVLRQIGEHERDLALGVLVEQHCLTERIPVAEVPACERLAHRDRARVDEGRFRIAGENLVREDVEHVLVDDEPRPPVERVVAVNHEPLARALESHERLHLGKLLGEHRTQHLRGGRETVDLARDVELVGDAIDPLVLDVVTVVGELAAQIQREDRAACDREGQPRDVDQRVELVAIECAQGDLERVSEHRASLGAPPGRWRASGARPRRVPCGRTTWRAPRRSIVPRRPQSKRRTFSVEPPPARRAARAALRRPRRTASSLPDARATPPNQRERFARCGHASASASLRDRTRAASPRSRLASRRKPPGAARARREPRRERVSAPSPAHAAR